MPAELAVRRGVRLEPRGGACSAIADFLLLPSAPAHAKEAFARARDLTSGGAGSVTLAGSERSFESHFLPRDAAAPSAVVSSRRLRGGVEILGKTSAGALRVRAPAGTSFAELCRAVHATGAEFMPFSCPTADAISLGGALAVNTHGRTSATYGGLFAAHVTAFELVDAGGRSHDCRADADGDLERRLYRYVPGALGALGLVTVLELELCAISPRARVVVEVLEVRTDDPLPAVRSYLARVADNRNDGFRSWSEGLSLVFFGAPARGASVVLGRRRGEGAEPIRSALPLFRESRRSNLFVQAFSHRFPALSRSLARRVLAEGKSFSSAYYRWAFFQSSFDEGAARFGRQTTPLAEALGLEGAFGLVHQGWVVGASNLEAFIAFAAEAFERPEHEAMLRVLEFFDVLPLPPPAFPLDPSGRVGGDAHSVTLSFAVRNQGEREHAQAFCRELTENALERRLAVVVQLNKQHHVEPTLLRRMHEPALGELARLKRVVDPDGLLGSRTLERLGL